MTKVFAFALAALISVPSASEAQRPEDRIEAAKARASAAGVPVALLENRVAEGRAKGIPMDRIATAVERRATSLASAREAMGRGRTDLTPAVLDAGADALDAGIHGGALRSVIEQARGEDRPVAIAVLTYLHGREGVPVDVALERVKGALEKGPDALRHLPTDAAAGRHKGGQPSGRGRHPASHGGGSSANAGRGNHGGGPPKAVPAPGTKPGAGKPGTHPGRGNDGGRGKGHGKP